MRFIRDAFVADLINHYNKCFNCHWKQIDNLSAESHAVIDTGPYYNTIKSRDVIIIGIFVNLAVIIAMFSYTSHIATMIKSCFEIFHKGYIKNNRRRKDRKKRSR